MIAVNCFNKGSPACAHLPSATAQGLLQRGKLTVLTIVLVINTLIALGCWLAVWQLWQLRRRIRKVSDTLNSVEKLTDAILHGAPKAILKGQSGTRSLRSQYQQLDPQVQRVRQVLQLLSLAQTIWQQPLLRSAWKRTSAVRS